ncbi:MAG TPA: ribbon-helix-helix domain-containing protein [Beijerinckiaceae bacterium]|nr:ribbon-helix-helix domain-containing protein [Beijerinckiaceae bacterium]
MSGRVIKRSVSIAGHRTSISLEESFWNDLKVLAARRSVSAATLIAEVDGERRDTNLSSALRVHVLDAAKAGLLSAPYPAPQKERSTA